MSALPTVSVVIPVKDRAEELKRCLGSLSCLTYPREKLQIIVVDDGSSDDSAEVARQAGARVVSSG
ncbi:MAG: glycosyltransferase, partial [Desulfuromonadales bacterium]